MQRHREQLAFWTFDGPPIFKEDKPIYPKVSLNPIPYLTMHHQDIDDSGTDGYPYTDVNNVAYRASRAISWDDIKGSGPDAELHIHVSTCGWAALAMRFDYRSESADNFDVDYRFDEDDNWTRLVRRHRLEPDYRWHATTLDLADHHALNDREWVTLRLHNFDRNGNDHLVLDNLELTGLRLEGHPAPPRIVGLPEAVSAVVGSTYQPPFNDERGFTFHVSHPTASPSSLNVDIEILDTDIIHTARAVPVREGYGIYRLELGPPVGDVGLTKLLVHVETDDGTRTTTAVPYGASAAPERDTTHFYTGTSDVSAIVEIDEDWMIAGGDEDNILRVYPRRHAAGPVNQMPLTTTEPDTPPFYLTDVSRDGMVREMDIEAVERLEDRIFWMCSHSNNDEGELRPNRHRVFATDVRVLEGQVSLQTVGYYDGLRDDLVAWGEQHGYDFATFMGEGRSAKAEDGMNIEGFTIDPETDQGLLGFRVPILDGQTLLIPIENFVQWFNNGAPVQPPTLGDPILLDMDGRGVRAMRRTDHGFLFVAGPPGEDGEFALYSWNGDPDDKPRCHAADLSGMRPEAMIVMTDGPFTDQTQVQLISDNGDTDWYDLGADSEDFIAPLQKFHSDIVTLGAVLED